MATVLATLGAETFSGMVAALQAEMDRFDAASEAAIKRSIVRQLQILRTKRFLFTEATATVTLVTGQSEYARGTAATALPADLRAIDNLRIEASSGAEYWSMRKVGIVEMRALQISSTDSGRPSAYCWHHDRLIVHYEPSVADVLRIDYHKDATLTEAGDAITANSTTESNDWFRVTGGEALLRSSAGVDLCLSFLRDSEQAEFYKVLADQAEEALKREYLDSVIHSGQIASYELG